MNCKCNPPARDMCVCDTSKFRECEDCQEEKECLEMLDFYGNVESYLCMNCAEERYNSFIGDYY